MSFVKAFMAIVSLIVCQTAHAAGFQIPEQGAKAAGLANAFTALADDPSAAWYNPAGIAFQDGGRLMAGGDIIVIPGVDFTANASNPAPTGRVASSSRETVIPPHLYVSYQWKDAPWGVGIAVNAPFGLKTNWPTNTAFASKNTFSKLEMLNVNPFIVWRVNERLAVAGGFAYYNVRKIRLDNTIQTLSANGRGYGGNAAIFYRGEVFRLGVSYRSRVDVNVDGTAFLVPLGLESAAFSSVTFPDMVNVGIAFKPRENIIVALEGDWVNWKSFRDIEISYASAAYLAGLNAIRARVGGAPVSMTVIKENWRAVFALRAGLEWRYRPNMRMRIGYSFDPTPVDDVYFTPAIPDNDRHLFSAGWGYDLTDSTTLDLAYMFVYFNERNQTASPIGDLPRAPELVKNGRYKARAHLITASLTMAF